MYQMGSMLLLFVIIIIEPISSNFTEAPCPTNIAASVIESDKIVLTWEIPSSGIRGYEIKIIKHIFNYKNPLRCTPSKKAEIIDIFDPWCTFYEINRIKNNLLPYQIIEVQMASFDFDKNLGPWSELHSFTTKPQAPDSVSNLNIFGKEDKMVISWSHPCFSNGNILYFMIEGRGTRNGFPTHDFNYVYNVTQVRDDYQLEIPSIKALYNYKVMIRSYNVEVKNGSMVTENSFKSPPQIPPMSNIKLFPTSTPEKPTQVSITLSEFDSVNGDVSFYAVLVGEKNHIENVSSYCSWENCPKAKSWKKANQIFVDEYQATPDKWNPFIPGPNEIKPPRRYIVGEKNCENRDENEYCNGPLRLGTNYGFILRAFTQNGFRDSQVYYFTTDAAPNSYILLIALISVISSGAIIAFSYIFVIKRRKQWQMERKHRNKLKIDLAITADEASDCGSLPVDAELINEEFNKLEKNTKKIHHSFNVASDERNKNKNRYGNIFPYDYNRVKLLDTCSEGYINASHIDMSLNGIDPAKFIATQGPMQNTSPDFWAMVASYNVSVIVMLCKTVEQKKVKCDVYYPEEGQNKQFGNYSVYCIRRNPSKSFVVRDLILVKDGQKYNISHFQYLKWPDFGVPTSSNALIEFCSSVKKAVPSDKSNPIVVHCSAGCGRTGTLIALYTMLKMKPSLVDIYSIVYKLRDQKMGMVQTKEQYIFLHKCLAYLKKVTSLND